MDLFDFTDNAKSAAPLSDRMRPKTLDEFIGQEHLIGKNMLLERAIRADKVGSCIFYGPPGTGKTTLASIIAASTKGEFVKLNAVSSGVADAKKVIDDAKNRLKMYGKRTYLLLDECHRWNKAQSDCVLAAIEDGSIIFIGSTTENPNLSMTRAIVSRCRVFEVKPLTDDNIKQGLRRAIADRQNGYGNLNVQVTEEAIETMVWGASGDLRNALNALELAVLSTPQNKDGVIVIDKEVASQSIQKKTSSISENGYYDMLSAFCKSLRGSDADAALYWAFKLVESGVDPLILFRRMIAHASEDVGMANPNALTFVVTAMNGYEKIGIPEGELTLAHAVVYLCTSPKSNKVYEAKAKAKQAVQEVGDDFVPLWLRNTDFTTQDKADRPYLYPHSFGGYVKQQYLPDKVKDEIFYEPTENGEEKKIAEFVEMIRKINKNND